MNNLDYGVIGNGRSAALISARGSIDWCCLPSFDSPSVFAKLLDEERGGSFAITLNGRAVVEQHYVTGTNILVSVLRRGENAVEVIDFMPRYRADNGGYHCPPDLIRFIRPLSGKPRIKIDYQPRLGYAKGETVSRLQSDHLKSTAQRPSYESLYLYSNLDLQAVKAGAAVEITGDTFLWLSYNEKLVAPQTQQARLEFQRTKVYWLNWVAEARIFPRWNDEIERSMLVLKLLAYQPTGAVLAAVTTSLPEEIGAERNWDYRFCWLRDASMTIKVFTQLGHYRVGSRFLNFILDVVSYKDEKVQIMYGINRQKELKESTLPWLKGYEGSGPVRVGNAAYKQKQHDIYGFVMDTIYQRLVDHPHSVENIEGLWTVVRTLTRNVEKTWRKPDAGIWEIRGEKQHFVFSKVLCWVAIDRAIKIAEYLNKPTYAVQWATLRQQIYRQVIDKGWNAELQAFTQVYGGTDLDASNLLMEHYGFIAADDPKYINTVKLSHEKLCRNGLMYRYLNDDDFGRPRSAFTVCTFWMIKSLHRIGEKALAEAMFVDILKQRNHLGLLSEDMDFESKRLLGNFPQGYSHLALIDTAITLAGEAEF